MRPHPRADRVIEDPHRAGGAASARTGADARPATPTRVRISHPRTDAVRRAPHRPPAREIDEQTSLGDIYMSALIRSQRRLALTVCAIIALLLAGTALAGALAPRFVALRLAGVPLPWLVLGVLVYPALIGLGWFAVRSAERNERYFVELVWRR